MKNLNDVNYKNLYLTLEDILSHLELNLEKVDHISIYSERIEYVGKTPIKEQYWKYYLIADELFKNNSIIRDYLIEIKNINNQLNDLLIEIKKGVEE